MATLIVLIIFILVAVLVYVALVLLVGAHDRRALAELQRQEAERQVLDAELRDWEYARLYERYGIEDWQVWPADILAGTMTATASTASVYPPMPRFRPPVRILAPPPLDVPGAD